MKKYLVVLSLLVACNASDDSHHDNTKDTTVNTATATSHNTLTEKEQSEGWKLLFDGQSKSGWHVYNNKSDGSAWKVGEGTLYLQPEAKKDFQTQGGGDIVTDEEFENFHLKLEWKLDTGGNSGIMFFVKEDPKYEHAWHTGPEMQVLDDTRHPDAKIDKHTAGDLYDLIAGSPETVKPAGEWNLAEIKAENGKLDFFLNGAQIVTTTMWDDNWKKMVANSKFKQWPDFATYKSGRIALQDHGDPVWFRNIRIRRL